jgi:hypothetical protein
VAEGPADRNSLKRAGDRAVKVTYFRQRRPGPESAIEDAVARQIPSLFARQGFPLWTAGSVPLGAGRPDLVAISYEPMVVALARVEAPNHDLLVYLHGVRRAHSQTIAHRIGGPYREIGARLDRLAEVGIVDREADTFWLSPRWRRILREVVSVEVKTNDWRRAVQQAARNRIFAHRSFVAFPESVAHRVCAEPLFGQLGIGVLAVSGPDQVVIVRTAAPRQPRVWDYYYRLASLAARHAEG